MRHICLAERLAFSKVVIVTSCDTDIINVHIFEVARSTVGEEQIKFN